jgi:hypothetical protein
MRTKHVYIPLVIMLLAVLAGCKMKESDKETSEVLNPAAEGFNENDSDLKAIEIADKVMASMGGRKNWDNTHFLCWNFFGSRQLIWDKWTGDVRIESYRDSIQYIVNINTMKGRASVKGKEVTDPDSLTQLLDHARRIWINDSYWLIMPYKLKDSGVTLKYLREDTTQEGIDSDVLQLTFNKVGVTPENKYEVWVDKESSMVRQWAYYRYDTLQEPGFVTPWQDWERKGTVMLSGNRGDKGSLSDIMVLDKCPENTFSSFDPINLRQVN